MVEYGVDYNGMSIDTATIENDFIKNDVIKSDKQARKILKHDITLMKLEYNAKLNEVKVKKVDMMAVDEQDKIDMAMVGIENFNHNLENKVITLSEEKSEFSTDQIDWNIDDKFKYILGYKCQKASTTYSLPNGSERDVVVWFTNEIPIQSGPYKLSGLPGLILEINTPTKRKIYARKIQFD